MLLRYLIGAIFLALVPLGVVETVNNNFFSAQIDGHRCSEGENADCLTEQRGIVHDGNAWWDIRVGYDDDQRKVGLALRGTDEPATGTRVRLERWNGEVVAVYDPATETRYRTYDWEERDSPLSMIGGVVLIAFLGVIGFLLGPQLIRWPVRRLRRRASSGAEPAERAGERVDGERDVLG